CETQNHYLQLTADTFLEFELEHHAQFLQSITIKGKKNIAEAATRNTLGMHELNRESGKPLATMLEQIAGVHAIKNGSGIAKPMIHGLTGNRIAILNNGVLQAGQQWGFDHAPEIDPFAARQITVIKGVDAIPYGGNSLGGVVLMEPGPIGKDPHAHGSALAQYQLNGNQLYSAAKLEQSRKAFDWRITAGYKRSGDHRSPDYFLRNTGLEEFSGSVQWLKDHLPERQHQLYYSFYRAQPGILRGSHIGNLTDLQEAIGRTEPFFTEDRFRYDIASPQQLVHHHLFKASHQWATDKQLLDWTYAAQLNQRKEFDIRRGGRDDIPALDLLLQSYSTEIKGRLSIRNQEIRYGLQYRFNYNLNRPGTGILPLIPDYALHNPGVYTTWKREWQRHTLELGGRYDLQWLSADTISRTLPRVVMQARHQFHNYSVSAGWKGGIFSFWTIRLNLGHTLRSPEVNELHSYGLHQAVAGIEEGQADLKQERSFKTVLTQTLTFGERLSFEFGSYFQQVSDFIYLEPQKELRLTIRGAFPVYQYKQTDARIYGLDAVLRLEFAQRWQWLIRYSNLQSEDLDRREGLVYMPPDQLLGQWSYTFPRIGAFRDVRLELEGKYVWKQDQHPPDLDFLDPPAAYFLIHPSLETNFRLFQKSWDLQIHLENAANIRYRDYLNRLRYFADEDGRNIRVQLRMDF
ncbi:MAG TPA: TonB-dependent receptor plug domain-containing protein, partial [Saprospiraceae bacterium]|nr:TonB-dependent receptor plug domain-containing protein [Saprospiraceae bacterium]